MKQERLEKSRKKQDDARDSKQAQVTRRNQDKD